MGWWTDRRRLARFVADLSHAELVHGRRGDADVPRLPWPETLRLDADARADSLERFALATALAEAIQLHRSGIEDALLTRRALAGWVDVAQAGLERHDAELTFRTSGSTGAPRAHAHRLADLEEEAEFLARIVVGARRVVRVVPCHHIYGFLFTILVPRTLGLEERDVVDARGRSPAGVAAALRGGDVVVGHPGFWSGLVRSDARVPPGVTGVTSTAPCPDQVARGVIELGLGRLVQVYGASETAGIGWKEGVAASFELMPFWQRRGSGIARTASDGSLREATLPDEVAWHGDRLFRVEARKDEAVQVGGMNVYPAAVRRVLTRHPGVREAAVRLMRRDEGERLKAFVVPAPHVEDLAGLERSLRHWIDERLAPAERPKALRFGAALPASAAGKPMDWPLDDPSAAA